MLASYAHQYGYVHENKIHICLNIKLNIATLYFTLRKRGSGALQAENLKNHKYGYIIFLG